MLVRVLSAFLFLHILMFTPMIGSASEEDFSTRLVANYYVDDLAQTRVEQNVVMVNQTSNSFVSDFALEIGAVDLERLRVKIINGDDLPHTVAETFTSTIVNINFPNPVIGRGSELRFQVSYLQSGIAQIQGEVLEINIPKQMPSQEFGSTISHLHVPGRFGDPSHLTPESNFSESRSETNIYTFIHTDDSRGNIRALFGDKQTKSFTLNYHLANTTINKGVAQIAIPPDTAYQKIYYTKIDPFPDKISADADGNWLATYSLDPRQELHIVVQGLAQVFLEPTVPVPSYTDPEAYLNPLPFWEVNHPLVRQKASQLKTARDIFDYLVENFSYNYNKLDSSNRLGGARALEEPSNAVCIEFTDAFVSLARAQGIPARSNNGFAYTNNPNLRPLSLVRDVLHAWPEYYDFDRQIWVPVDPTWSNTTGGIDYFNRLDFNRLTFAIHGLDSTLPYPAGFYKFDTSSEKDILVEFTDQAPQVTGEVLYQLRPSFLHLLGLPWQGQLTVINQTNQAIYNLNLDLASDTWELGGDQVRITSVLPFSHTTVPVRIQASTPFQLGASPVIIQSDNETKQITIQISRQQQLLFFAALMGVVGFFGLLAYHTWRLLVSR